MCRTYLIAYQIDFPVLFSLSFSFFHFFGKAWKWYINYICVSLSVQPSSSNRCCYFSFYSSLASVCHFFFLSISLVSLKSVCSMQMGIGNANDNNGKHKKEWTKKRSTKTAQKKRNLQTQRLIQIKWIDVAIHYLCKLDVIIKDILMWQLKKNTIWRSKPIVNVEFIVKKTKKMDRGKQRTNGRRINGVWIK